MRRQRLIGDRNVKSSASRERLPSTMAIVCLVGRDNGIDVSIGAEDEPHRNVMTSALS